MLFGFGIVHMRVVLMKKECLWRPAANSRFDFIYLYLMLLLSTKALNFVHDGLDV